MEDLRDRAFETHNEVTIRDGRKLIVVGTKLFDYNGKLITSDDEYSATLMDINYCFSKYDIMKVYNPITKELVFDRKMFVDWSTVAVDTKILVSCDGDMWNNRYFAKYEDGTVYTFINGRTSWTNGNKSFCPWNYAKLAESEVK